MMITEPLAFESRPSLRSPVLLLAFSGWSDAGASATTAVRYLVDQLLAKKFASIDPEDFYDFSTATARRAFDGKQAARNPLAVL